ncbi:MAG TPA: ABC transporter ATP-binding protein, partial [Zeimonas sp.]|nr:ABC transporter ATP-binding protein [Zeimonas sp.]
IVLDEPTAGVDVELRQGLWQFVRRLNREGHTIVLTTHYLEEAQELCDRIAMLKQGTVVALDRTRSLLHRFAGGRLQLRLAGAPLPRVLEPLRVEDPVANEAGRDVAGSGERVSLRVDDYASIEGMLAALREAGCRVDEMELLHTDLEDVFVQVMKETR